MSDDTTSESKRIRTPLQPWEVLQLIEDQHDMDAHVVSQEEDPIEDELEEDENVLLRYDHRDPEDDDFIVDDDVSSAPTPAQRSGISAPVNVVRIKQ